MDEDQYELDHLHGGQISFPAQIFLYARAARGSEEVVEVHQAVHPRVEEGAEPALAASDKPRPPPAEPGQGPVVDDVEGREVGELLAGNKEHRVGQVNKLIKNNCGHSGNYQGWLCSCLGEEIPPGEVESPPGCRTVRVVHRLTGPAVMVSPQPEHGVEYPAVEHSLAEVVDQQQSPEIKGFPVMTVLCVG